jgi:hypothetical protein
LKAAVHLGVMIETMKKTTKHVAPWLAIAAVAGTLFLAPVASADTGQTGGDNSTQTGGADPEVPYGSHSNFDLPDLHGGNSATYPAGAV